MPQHNCTTASDGLSLDFLSSERVLFTVRIGKMKQIKARAALLLFFLFLSCNGKSVATSVPDALLHYPEVDLVTFSISGTAVCTWCKTSEVSALQVEVVPSDDPITTLSVNIFGGVGSFTFTDLRYKKGAKLTLYGKVYFGTGDTETNSTVEISVPDNDGQTVSCIINFPHR
jgi:hypothetical protein